MIMATMQTHFRTGRGRGIVRAHIIAITGRSTAGTSFLVQELEATLKRADSQCAARKS